MAGSAGRPRDLAGLVRLGKWRVALVLIWLCFLIRGVVYSIALPLWEGYDEWSHFAYIQHVATGRSLPHQAATRVSEHVARSLEAAPLSWTQRALSPRIITHDAFWKMDSREREQLSRQLLAIPAASSMWASSDGPVIYEAQQPPLYYWLMAIPLRLVSGRSIVAQAFTLRIVNVLIASMFVPLYFLLAKLVWLDEGLAISTVALAVAMPELLIYVSRISNDALALLLLTSLLILSVDRAGHTMNAKAAIAARATLGLGLLTKAFLLTAVPALLILSICFRGPTPERRLRSCGVCLLTLAVAASISFFWFWHNFSSTGAWSGLAEDVMLPRVSFRMIVLCAIVGLGLFFARRKELPGPWPSKRALAVAAIFYASFLAGLAYHVLVIFLARGESTSTGWYLYTLVAAEAILLAAGLRALIGLRLQHLVFPALLVCYMLLDLYAFHFVMLPYHAGLISHRADGSLLTFHLAQLRGLSASDLVGRFLVNRPAFLTRGMLLVMWSAYWAASAYLLAVVIRASRSEARSSTMLR